MKLIHSPQIVDINFIVNSVELENSVFQSHVDLYSCKRTAQTKKLARSLEEDQLRVSSSDSAEYGSPATIALNATVVEVIVEDLQRRLLANLIDVLNETFPDYDFGSAHAEQFIKHSDVQQVLLMINTAMRECVPNFDEQRLADRWWAAIASEISLNDEDTVAYSFTGESNPFAANAVWSFNFFLYDKKRKKMLLWHGKQCGLEALANADDVNDVDALELDYQNEDIFSFE